MDCICYSKLLDITFLPIRLVFTYVYISNHVLGNVANYIALLN